MDAQPIFPKSNHASLQTAKFRGLAGTARPHTRMGVRGNDYLVLILTLALIGCASPPGLPQPAPLDPAEVTRSTDRFRQYATDMRAVDGVISVHLSSHNNPREMVVTVDRETVADNLRNKYGRETDGIRIRYEIIATQKNARLNNQAIRVIPSTWWGRLLDYVQNWRQYVFPEEKTANQKPT